MIKLKKKDREAYFTLGISLVGVSVVFIAAINKAIGLAFLAMGIMWIIISTFSKK